MKKIVIDQKDFEVIVRFCMSVSIGFDKIEEAAQMKAALKSAKIMDLNIENNEQS